jgi:hypothetical protein
MPSFHTYCWQGFPAPPLQLSDEPYLELMHMIAVASRTGVENEGDTYPPHPAEAVEAVEAVEKIIEIGRPSRLKDVSSTSTSTARLHIHQGSHDRDERGRPGVLARRAATHPFRQSPWPRPPTRSERQ